MPIIIEEIIIMSEGAAGEIALIPQLHLVPTDLPLALRKYSMTNKTDNWTISVTYIFQNFHNTNCKYAM